LNYKGEILNVVSPALQVPLEVVAPLEPKKLDGVTLGLSGDHQLVNAGLAVSLSRCWLQRTGNWKKIFPNVGRFSWSLTFIKTLRTIFGESCLFFWDFY